MVLGCAVGVLAELPSNTLVLVPVSDALPVLVLVSVAVAAPFVAPLFVVVVPVTVVVVGGGLVFMLDASRAEDVDGLDVAMPAPCSAVAACAFTVKGAVVSAKMLELMKAENTRNLRMLTRLIMIWG